MQIALRKSGRTQSEEQFLNYFTQDLRTLWLAGKNKASDVPAGPILHTYFGWGVFPGHEVALVEVEVEVEIVDGLTPFYASGGRVVIVDLKVNGKPRTNKVFVKPSNSLGKGWLIDNITYDKGEDFRSFRKRLAGQ